MKDEMGRNSEPPDLRVILPRHGPSTFRSVADAS